MYERAEAQNRVAWKVSTWERGEPLVQPAGPTNRRSFVRLDTRVWTKFAEDSLAQRASTRLRWGHVAKPRERRAARVGGVSGCWGLPRGGTQAGWVARCGVVACAAARTGSGPSTARRPGLGAGL
jgi:hypothetical protein